MITLWLTVDDLLANVKVLLPVSRVSEQSENGRQGTLFMYKELERSKIYSETQELVNAVLGILNVAARMLIKSEFSVKYSQS